MPSLILPNGGDKVEEDGVKEVKLTMAGK